MRSRMLLAFEQAESEGDPTKRKAWLTFVVVGGGPTGVELAGALAELARTGLDQEYRAINPATTRVILVQSAPRVLPLSLRFSRFTPDGRYAISAWRSVRTPR